MNYPLEYINNIPIQSVPTDQDLSLLVWNIFKGHRENSWKHLSGLLSQTDFVAIQEMVFHPKTEYDFLKKHPETHWVLGTSFVYEKTGTHTGTASASDYRVSNTDFLLSQAQEPLFRTPKSAMTQTYPITNRGAPLMIAHIHAINFTRFTSFKGQIDDFLEHVSRHKGPVIISGDFNTHLYPRKKYLLREIERLGLNHSKPEHDRRLFPFTHVFYRGVRINKHHYEKSITSSDHKPFIVNFTIQ